MSVKNVLLAKTQKFRDEFMEMDKSFRIAIILITLVGGVSIVGTWIANTAKEREKPASSQRRAAPGSEMSSPTLPPSEAPDASIPGNPAFSGRVLPTTPRNQGLENVMLELNETKERLAHLERERDSNARQPGKGAPESGQSTAFRGSVDLNAAPPVAGVAFDDIKVPTAAKSSYTPNESDATTPGQVKAKRVSRMTVSLPEEIPEQTQIDAQEAPAVAVNSGIDAMMLSGINARQAGAGGQAAGGSTTANNVGAPFVTKLKGDVILPNGWRSSDLGDCFLGGSAVAVISTGRAYAVAESISCINREGEIWEAPVKAYALDSDGTLGIAGKVVSKQGTLLQQAALTGMVSGLAQAFTPTATSTYATTTGTSTQAVTLPNPSLVASTAVGQGLNSSQQQLSRFYMEYAREIFPVVEVPAGTRLTWIFKETIVLKKRIVKH